MVAPDLKALPKLAKDVIAIPPSAGIPMRVLGSQGTGQAYI